MDMNSVAYKDKVREKERQEKLAVYKETGEWPGLKRKKESVSSIARGSLVTLLCCVWWLGGWVVILF